MINGYVTYDELKLITGFSDELLSRLLLLGMSYHELEVNIEIDKRFKKPLTERLFNLDEVQKWLSAHIF